MTFLVARLEIAIVEEHGKENGVREVHDECEDRAREEFVTVITGNTSSSNDINADEHLRKLQRGEKCVPVVVESHRGKCIVGIHKTVNKQIHHGKWPSSAVEGDSDLIGIPAIQAGHDVVIPM